MKKNTIETYIWNDRSLDPIDGILPEGERRSIALDMDWTLRYCKSFGEHFFECLEEYSLAVDAWLQNDSNPLPTCVLDDLKEWVIDSYDWLASAELRDEIAAEEEAEYYNIA